MPPKRRPMFDLLVVPNLRSDLKHTLEVFPFRRQPKGQPRLTHGKEVPARQTPHTPLLLTTKSCQINYFTSFCGVQTRVASHTGGTSMHLETEWEWRLRDVEPLEEQQQPLSAEFINDLRTAIGLARSVLRREVAATDVRTYTVPGSTKDSHHTPVSGCAPAGVWANDCKKEE